MEVELQTDKSITVLLDHFHNQLRNQIQTPLHFASENGYLEISKYLIEKGVDANSVWKFQIGILDL